MRSTVAATHRLPVCAGKRQGNCDGVDRRTRPDRGRRWGPGAGDAQVEVEVRRRRMHLKKASQIDPILAPVRHHALPFAFQKDRASSLSGRVSGPSHSRCSSRLDSSGPEIRSEHLMDGWLVGDTTAGLVRPMDAQGLGTISGC